MRSFLKLFCLLSVLRRRVLKSAEQEQLLQQLKRGGQKKSEQPPFGKKLRRKISKSRERSSGF